MDGAGRSRSSWIVIGLVSLFCVAAAQRGWNAFTVPPLTGYDSPAHAGYMLAILEEGALPHPYSGWSTFHPPLYYLLGSGVWALLEPLGPRAVVAGIRAIGSLAGLVAALVAFRLMRRLGHDAGTAWMSTALVVFVPVAQMAGTMIGNEALAAGLMALAFSPLLALQRDPQSLRAAAVAGVLVGLACCVKYTGVIVLLASSIPFLAALHRGRLGPRARASAGLLLALVALVAAPTYVRNVALTGTMFPVTRDREPMRSAEASMVLRERRVADFLWVPPDALLRPSLYQEPEKVGSFRNRNAAMTSVWGLTHASTWFDPFGHRTSVRAHRDGVWYGPALTLLGLGPTLAVLLGLGLCVREAWATRLGCATAPLTLAAVAGLLMYTAIAASAPSPAALKSSYLLGLGVPAAVFYARGVGSLGRRWRHGVLAVSAAACLVAGLVFTSGVLFPARPMGVRVWTQIGEALPQSYIADAIARLTVGWY